MSNLPLGEEREVKRSSGVSLDGAPLTYIVTLAAVVAVLAFVPLSVVLGSGKSFPLSQGIYPLVGWLLGPVAGAVANAIGALIGVFLAPHTSTFPVATISGALAGGLAAGAMARRGSRSRWWLPLSVVFLLVYLLYAGRAVFQNGARLDAVLAGSFIDWSAWLLFVLPTRGLVAGWLAHAEKRRVAAGLFLGTWIAAGLSHLTGSLAVYLLVNWPNEVWGAMVPLALLEHLARCLVGAVIGSGVIAGLRATGMVKPTHAVY
ncbi:MAG: hypothetical protein DRI37_09090 [Chloroflexi bacterium]|nr:MAG: hypothetical protein DRI37_09090 [Chloroflexota bacterium]